MIPTVHRGVASREEWQTNNANADARGSMSDTKFHGTNTADENNRVDTWMKSREDEDGYSPLQSLLEHGQHKEVVKDPLFERLVQIEMERQLENVRRMRELDQLRNERDENQPLYQNQDNMEETGHNASKDGYAGTESINALDPIPIASNVPGMKIGFGRGLSSLHGDRARDKELEKKLLYQKELDRQLEEKRRLREREKDQDYISKDGGALPTPSLQQQPAENWPPKKLKQLEYAQILGQQVREKEEQKRLERLRREEEERRLQREEETLKSQGTTLPGPPSGTGASTCTTATQRSPLPMSLETNPGGLIPDGVDLTTWANTNARFRFGNMDETKLLEMQKKLAQQQQVQSTLLEQIEERKKRQEEEKRLKEQQEAEEEARIQRELLEMKIAYEREQMQQKQLLKLQNPSHQNQHPLPSPTSAPTQAPIPPSRSHYHHPYAMSPATTITSNSVSPQSIQDQSPIGRNYVRGQGITGLIDFRDSGESNPDSSAQKLAADLAAKREAMLQMQQQQASLERELERQRNELRRLKRMSSLSPPLPEPGQDEDVPLQVSGPTEQLPQQQQLLEAGMPPVYRSQRRRSHNFADDPNYQAIPPRHPYRGNTTTGGIHQPLEQSMMSKSKLVRAHYQPFSANPRLDETWRPQIVKSPTPHQFTYGRDKAAILEGDEADPNAFHQSSASNSTLRRSRNSENLVEKSLPCASRYFIYVAQKKDEDTSDEKLSLSSKVRASKGKAEMKQSKSSARRASTSGESLESSANGFRENDDSFFQISPAKLPLAQRQPRSGQRASSERDNNRHTSRMTSPSPSPAALGSVGGTPGASTPNHQILLDDLEQSRVRTAQAARMALQRASAHSDDEDSMGQLRSRKNTPIAAKNERYKATPSDDSLDSSIDTEIEKSSSLVVPTTPPQPTPVNITQGHRFRVHTPTTKQQNFLRKETSQDDENNDNEAEDDDNFGIYVSD